jgi:ribonuclease P protein component
VPVVGRLLSGDDFARVLRARRVGASRHFELFSDAAGTAGPRLGLAISKRTAPTAVLRNLAKRLARESARASKGLMPADYVVRSRVVLNANWQQAKQAKQTSAFKRSLRAELDGLFARVCRAKEQK